MDKFRCVLVVNSLINWLMCTTGCLLIIFTSCEPDPEFLYESFIIKKGSHNAELRVESLQQNRLVFSALFDSSAIYAAKDAANQHDLNKLLGFSDCNDHHHVNSARFGWRWLDNCLEIHAYVYQNGVRTIEYLADITIGKVHHYEIKLEGEAYTFYLDRKLMKSIERDNDCTSGLYYLLFPYFGGDEVAPHDIIILIKRAY